MPCICGALVQQDPDDGLPLPLLLLLLLLLCAVKGEIGTGAGLLHPYGSSMSTAAEKSDNVALHCADKRLVQRVLLSGKARAPGPSALGL